MNYSNAALSLIVRFAPLNFTASRDNFGWNIGYLCRDDIGRFQIGPGQKIDKEQAESLMKSRANCAQDLINDHVKIPLSQHEFDALVSHIYFIPQMKMFASSVLLEHLNAGDKFRAAKAIMDESLDDRRLRHVAEVHMFVTGIVVADILK
jgi:GH24 family phage-related lysozyme (muramidase)